MSKGSIKKWDEFVNENYIKDMANTSEKSLKIDSYLKDIEKLEKMVLLYNECENLNGGFYTDMISEIEAQIKHCKECIDNLNKYDTGKGGYYITVKSPLNPDGLEVLVKSNASMKSITGWFTTDTKSNVGEVVAIENNMGTRVSAMRIK